MSLNNIFLNHQLLAQLYPNTLLETSFGSGKPTHTQAPKQQVPGSIQTESPAQTIVAGRKEQFIEAAATETVTPIANTPSLGGNKKGILILLQNEVVPFLPDTELEFLSAILGACKLSIADVAIVNMHHYPQVYTSLLQQFNSKQVLLMGVTPQQLDLPFHFPHFQLQQFDKRTYLYTHPLGLMAQNKELKMQLWSCLKAMFGI